MANDRRRSPTVQSTPRDFSAPGGAPEIPISPVLARVSLGCVLVAVTLAVLALFGWALEKPVLAQLVPGWAPMRLNTVLILCLVAGACLSRRWLAAGCVAAAGLIVALQVLEYAAGLDLGVDQLIVADPSPVPHPGRTSLPGLICLGLLVIARGAALARRRIVAQAAGSLAGVIGLFSLIGFAYNVESLYSLGQFSTLALPTAVAVVLLALAVLAGVHDGVLPWMLFAPDPGASLVRRLLPTTVLGVPLMGYICVRLEAARWVDGTATIALLVILCGVAVGSVSAIAATHLRALDRRRARTLADLTRLKNSLQHQVVDRAAQVAMRRNEIAVLEDRQRIAADLHDIVIQRLFAAGMFLQGASDSLDEDTRRRVDTAVESMDAAIRDLRNSIFELGGNRTRTVDLASELDAVCAESARVLGFTPDLTVDDPEDEAESVREDVLAVLRESLANVARHARATSVDVALRTGHGLIGLTVIDDGRGIREAPHSSGTRNMADRARRLGGDCVWTAMQPHGTRVWWYVPGVPAVPSAPGTVPMDPPVDESTATETVLADLPVHEPTAAERSVGAGVVSGDPPSPAVLGDT